MYSVWLSISGSLLVMFKVNGALQRRSMDCCEACACNWLGAPKRPAERIPYPCVYILLRYNRIVSALSLRYENISHERV